MTVAVHCTFHCKDVKGIKENEKRRQDPTVGQQTVDISCPFGNQHHPIDALEQKVSVDYADSCFPFPPICGNTHNVYSPLFNVGWWLISEAKPGKNSCTRWPLWCPWVDEDSDDDKKDASPNPPMLAASLKCNVHMYVHHPWVLYSSPFVETSEIGYRIREHKHNTTFAVFNIIPMQRHTVDGVPSSCPSTVGTMTTQTTKHMAQRKQKTGPPLHLRCRSLFLWHGRVESSIHQKQKVHRPI